MNVKDLKIEFRYLAGNIACMSIDSIAGKPIHNDINNEDAIKMFNALIGSKENSILEENRQLQNNWNELKEWLEEEFEHYDKYGNAITGVAMGQIKRTQNKIQELEGKSE